MVITLGIYAIYWFYATLSELHTANDKNEGALLWTVLALIPFINLFAYWHYASEFATFNYGKYPSLVVFIAWIVFSPLVWLLVQLDLNKAADGGVPSVVSQIPEEAQTSGSVMPDKPRQGTTNTERPSFYS